MNKSKIYMIICICILCISVIGSTLAYYTKTLFNKDVNTITHGLDYYINYNKGQNITDGNLIPTTLYTDGISADIELWKVDNTYDIYGHMYLDIKQMSDELSESDAIRYTVTEGDDVLYTGYVNKSATGSILVASNIPLETNKKIYTVYIWLDYDANPSMDLESEILSLEVRCEATMQLI